MVSETARRSILRLVTEWYLRPEAPLRPFLQETMMKPVYVVVRMIDHEKTGLLVRRERQKQGISVTDLAAIAGISVSYLCCLENGDRAWSEELFARVTRGLSCDT